MTNPKSTSRTRSVPFAGWVTLCVCAALLELIIWASVLPTTDDWDAANQFWPFLAVFGAICLAAFCLCAEPASLPYRITTWLLCWAALYGATYGLVRFPGVMQHIDLSTELVILLVATAATTMLRAALEISSPSQRTDSGQGDADEPRT